MIYYPLSTLMLAGIREILIITTPHEAHNFKALLGDGSNLGISLEYAVQSKPEGLAQAFIIGESFIGEDNVALILGDNIFYGSGLGRRLSGFSKTDGATIFGINVPDPQRYGVLEVSPDGKILSIEEKPNNPKSNFAVPGLYFFDSTVSVRAKNVTKSKRGELEITSVIDSYLLDKKLSYKILEDCTAWMDCGTVESLLKASNYIQNVENETGFKIGSVEEISFRLGYIDEDQLLNCVANLGTNEYSNYLVNILKNKT